MVVLLAPGCGERDPAKRAAGFRSRFLAAVQANYADRNRDMARERDIQSLPLVHEYVIDHDVHPKTGWPATDEEGMPAAKRKLLYPEEKERADEVVPDAYEATVRYLVITYQREEEKLAIPADPVDPEISPDMISLKEGSDAVRAVYYPNVYRWGRQHFVFRSGKLAADGPPVEDPLTEAERNAAINPPEAAKSDGKAAE